MSRFFHRHWGHPRPSPRRFLPSELVSSRLGGVGEGRHQLRQLRLAREDLACGVRVESPACSKIPGLPGVWPRFYMQQYGSLLGLVWMGYLSKGGFHVHSHPSFSSDSGSLEFGPLLEEKRMGKVQLDFRDSDIHRFTILYCNMQIDIWFTSTK